MLLHGKWIRNPIWPPYPLIDWHILDFFSRTAEGIYSNVVTNVLNGVTNKCVTFKWIRNPICPPFPLICWHILYFFSRTASGIYYNLVINVPYRVTNKCYYFLRGSEIQNGCPGLWLADTFSTSFQELFMLNNNQDCHTLSVGFTNIAWARGMEFNMEKSYGTTLIHSLRDPEQVFLLLRAVGNVWCWS